MVVLQSFVPRPLSTHHLMLVSYKSGLSRVYLIEFPCVLSFYISLLNSHYLKLIDNGNKNYIK